jgi:3-oxoacyl-[acyl-carrier protein] reductase
MLLDGRTAVITGAADGIGWVIAQVFASEGANLVLGDIDETRVTARAAELVGAGGRSIGVACNVTDESDVERLARAAIDEFGSIDVWVNNAGMTRDNVMRKMTLDDFRMVIDVNLTGTWIGTRAAVAGMRETGSAGSIINLSSISGKVGNPGQTNYSAAKAGIVGLTKASAKEAARHGIRANAIQPGLIRTAMTDRMDQAALAMGVEAVPLGRIGEPEEVARVAVFLASDLSSYVTGAVIEVTGGRHM